MYKKLSRVSLLFNFSLFSLFFRPLFYGVRPVTRPRVKEQKSINMLPSPSVRTIIVLCTGSRHTGQYHWRLQSVPLSLTARSFSLEDLAGSSTSRRQRPGKVTEHSCSHATMRSNGAAALLTMPGHRGPPVMSAEAAGELEESRGSACGGHSHSIAKLIAAAPRCTLSAMFRRQNYVLSS
jgi:hypothetical protein